MLPQPHVYNETVNLIGSCAVEFGANGPSHLTDMVAVIGMEGMVSNTRRRYAR